MNTYYDDDYIAVGLVRTAGRRERFIRVGEVRRDGDEFHLFLDRAVLDRHPEVADIDLLSPREASDLLEDGDPVTIVPRRHHAVLVDESLRFATDIVPLTNPAARSVRTTISEVELTLRRRVRIDVTEECVLSAPRRPWRPWP